MTTFHSGSHIYVKNIDFTVVQWFMLTCLHISHRVWSYIVLYGHLWARETQLIHEDCDLSINLLQKHLKHELLTFREHMGSISVRFTHLISLKYVMFLFCFVRSSFCILWPILSVYLDCPILIVHSVFSNVYIKIWW